MYIQRVYEDEAGWVEIGVINDLKILTAHTEGKYSIGMLKAMRRCFKILGEDVITVLPGQYLVDFFSKHCNVDIIDIKKKLYRVYR